MFSHLHFQFSSCSTYPSIPHPTLCLAPPSTSNLVQLNFENIKQFFNQTSPKTLIKKGAKHRTCSPSNEQTRTSKQEQQKQKKQNFKTFNTFNHVKFKVSICPQKRVATPHRHGCDRPHWRFRYGYNPKKQNKIK